MANLLTRRRDALEALAAHNLALARLSSTINDPDTLVLSISINDFESSAIVLGTCLRELLLYQRKVKTLNQSISEETGIDLSPVAIARDQRLRTLYENIVKARGTDEEIAAREIFAAFVKREYP